MRLGAAGALGFARGAEASIPGFASRRVVVAAPAWP